MLHPNYNAHYSTSATPVTNLYGSRQIYPMMSTSTNHHLMAPASSYPMMSSSSFAKQPFVRPVQFRSANVASTPSANIRWSSAEAVNFMDHLYFITNLVLDYLLEDQLPQQLVNQTLFDDPIAVVVDHRNELISHFHKLLIAACSCLCIGISIPLFGFMIACCWCSAGTKSPNTKSRSTSRSGRPTSRSRSARRDPSDADWLALAARDSSSSGYHNGRSGGGGANSGTRYLREPDRRRRHGARGHRRAAAGSSGVGGHSASSSHHYRSRSIPPSLRYESACHPCLRTFFSSNFFVLLLLIAFFTVCAFVTNEYVNNGVKQLPRALNQSVDELQVYLNNTDHEIDNLFRVNYRQLENELNLRLDTSGAIIKHKLAVSSEAIALVNLTNIVAEFNDTKIRLERLDRELQSLKSKFTTAKRGLRDFRILIETCPSEQCGLLRKKYTNLDLFRILPQYEKLPDVKHIIRKINLLIDSGIVGQVQRGREDFDRVATFIQREVNGTTPEVKTQLGLLGKKLSQLASDVSQSIHWSDQFFNQSKSSTERLGQYTQYEQYRRYGCLAGASVILFILLCYTLGWFYGSCRPIATTRTWKTRVNTSASASIPFSCGVFTVFLLFLPLILAAIVLFLTGSIGDKVVCRVVKHPEQRQSKQIYAMLQNKFLAGNLPLDSVDSDKVTIENIDGRDYKIYRPNYADLIARCHQNQSIYKVLRLDQYDKVYLADNGRGRRLSIGLDKSFNLNSAVEFKKMNNIDAKLKELIRFIDFDMSRVVLLSPQAEDILKSSMSLSFDDIEMSFARLYDNGVTISHIDIEQLIKDFNAQKALTSNDTLEGDISINTILATSFTEHLLPNITSSLLNLKEGVRHLKLKMFHGRNSFGSVMGELIGQVRSAERQLRNDGNRLIKAAGTEFIDELNALVDQYGGHVRNQVENVIGQCEPVSRALNSTTSTLCDDIILPFNGYWLSAVASLILILPATLLAYALRGLYKLVRRGPHSHHNYSYTDQEDDLSYEDDGEEIGLAYHLRRHSHHLSSHKPPGSAPLPSAPVAADDWSPSSSGYVHDSRPPPYAL